MTHSLLSFETPAAIPKAAKLLPREVFQIGPDRFESATLIRAEFTCVCGGSAGWSERVYFTTRSPRGVVHKIIVHDAMKTFTDSPEIPKESRRVNVTVQTCATCLDFPPFKEDEA